MLRTLRRPLPRYRPKEGDREEEEEGDRIVLSGHLFQERSLGLGHWKLQWMVLTANASLGTLALHYQNPKEEVSKPLAVAFFSHPFFVLSVILLLYIV